MCPGSVGLSLIIRVSCSPLGLSAQAPPFGLPEPLAQDPGPHPSSREMGTGQLDTPEVREFPERGVQVSPL